MASTVMHTDIVLSGRCSSSLFNQLRKSSESQIVFAHAIAPIAGLAGNGSSTICILSNGYEWFV